MDYKGGNKLSLFTDNMSTENPKEYAQKFLVNEFSNVVQYKVNMKKISHIFICWQ